MDLKASVHNALNGLYRIEHEALEACVHFELGDDDFLEVTACTLTMSWPFSVEQGHLLLKKLQPHLPAARIAALDADCFLTIVFRSLPRQKDMTAIVYQLIAKLFRITDTEAVTSSFALL